MKRLKKFILVNFLLFGLVGFWSLSYVQAIEYGGLGIYPNASEVDEKNSLTKSWFIYTLEPGEVKDGKVDIANISDVAVEAKIYPVDAVTTKDGSFAPELEDKEKIDVGSWTTLAKSEVSLEPNEVKTIDFTVRVPENAEVGDHMGAIIVQGKKPPEEIEGSGLRITTRVGVRMYITIPGDIIRELEFTEFTQKTEVGKVIFYLTFVNNGNVRIIPKGEIRIIDVSGNEVDSIKITEREVFPRKAITIPIEWKTASLSGKFTARASVVYDANKTLTQELTLEIISQELISGASSPQESTSLTFLPQKVLLGLGVGVGIIILLIIILLVLVIAKKIYGRRGKK